MGGERVGEGEGGREREGGDEGGGRIVNNGLRVGRMLWV